MNKKLISLAVAATMAAPTAAMAEAILYGKLHLSLDYVDWDNNAYSSWGINRGANMWGSDRNNRIGVKGSEDIGNGLKAIYQVEFEIYLSPNDNDVYSGNNGGIDMRNSFVGVAGSFGTILVGRHDTPYKITTQRLELFADTMADNENTVGLDDWRVDNTIAYISPSFSGFQFMGALVVPGGATVGLGGAQNVNADQLNEAYSLAAIYSNGPFYGSIAYESANNEIFMDTWESETDGNYCYNSLGYAEASCQYVEADYNKWRLGFGILDWNGFTFTAIYEDQNDRPDGQRWTDWTLHGPRDQRLWQIQVGYTFGNNMVKGMYGGVDRDYDYADNDDDDWEWEEFENDRNTWALAFDHNFTKRTKAYVLYTGVDDDADPRGQLNALSFGMVHSF
jgi:predicted porin